MADKAILPRLGDVMQCHGSNELITVAWCDGERLSWLGYPDGGSMLLKDCTMVQRCTDEQHERELKRIANSDGRTASKAYAMYSTSASNSPFSKEAKATGGKEVVMVALPLETLDKIKYAEAVNCELHLSGDSKNTIEAGIRAISVSFPKGAVVSGYVGHDAQSGALLGFSEKFNENDLARCPPSGEVSWTPVVSWNRHIAALANADYMGRINMLEAALVQSNREVSRLKSLNTDTQNELDRLKEAFGVNNSGLAFPEMG